MIINNMDNNNDLNDSVECNELANVNIQDFVQIDNPINKNNWKIIEENNFIDQLHDKVYIQQL